MCTTSHTLPNQSGSAEQVTCAHSRQAAVQYDFYIPSEIQDNPSVQTFLTRLLALEPGATVSHGLTGIWRGETEETMVYRLILWEDMIQRSSLTDFFMQEIGRLMANLSLTPEKQQIFMYTETEIQINMTSLNGH